MPGDALTLVKDFFADLGSTEAENATAFEKFLADDVIWDTGSRVLHGLEACLTHVHHVPVEYGIAAFDANLQNIAVSGNSVLTERIDNLYAADGRIIYGVKVMGVLVAQENKIVEWRDYYDSAVVGKGIAEAKTALGL